MRGRGWGRQEGYMFPAVIQFELWIFVLSIMSIYQVTINLQVFIIDFLFTCIYF